MERSTSGEERRYTPAEILRSYRVLLRSPLVEGAPILVEGQLKLNRNKEYGGYYYGTLRDAEGKSITIKAPAPLGQRFIDDQIYVFRGTLDTKVSESGLRVELTISSLQEERAPRDDKRIRSLLKGVQRQEVLKEIERNLQDGNRPKIIAFYGVSAIVDSDVRSALGTTLDRFDLQERRVNLSSTGDLISALRKADHEGADALAVVRGGGEGLQSLDRLELLECCRSLKTPLICAVGHAEDGTFLRVVADQAFISPTQLGERLREIALQAKKWESREEDIQQKERRLREKEEELIQREQGMKVIQRKQRCLEEKEQELTKRERDLEGIRGLAWTEIVIGFILGGLMVLLGFLLFLRFFSPN